MAAEVTVETPSGKGAGDENFPVGSLLIAGRLRPHVRTFYAFARAADDIADNPGLAAEEKLRRLDGFEQALLGEAPGAGFETAARMRASLAASGVGPRHCRDLLAAFRQDAVQRRYESWGDLIAYCELSAAPVGRYLLDLHGEDPAGYAASDTLCNALQIINHLQDCGEDFRRLDRVYLPQAWLREAGAEEGALAAPGVSPALRQVLDRCLAGTRALLDEAAGLPRGLRSRRLGLEAAVILRIAERLIGRLSQADPLAERVVLSRGALASATLSGLLLGLGRSCQGRWGRG